MTPSTSPAPDESIAGAVPFYRSLMVRLFTLGMVMLLSTAAWQYFAFEKLQAYDDIALQRLLLADEILIGSLQARRAEKDFMLRSLDDEAFYREGRSEYLEKHERAMAHMGRAIDRLAGLYGEEWQQTAARLRYLVQTYDRAFARFVEQYRSMGDSQHSYEYNLEDMLHNVGHELMDLGLLDVLMKLSKLESLQNHFLALHDPEDLVMWQTMVNDLQLALPPTEKSRARELFDQYQKLFRKCLSHWQVVGLSPEQGLEGELRRAIHQVEPLVEEIQKRVAQEQGQTHQQLLSMGLEVCLVGVLMGSLLFLLFGRRLAHTLKDLRQAALLMGSGQLDHRVKVPGIHDEVRVLALAFNRMGATLSQTTVSRDDMDRILDAMAEALLVLREDGTIRMTNPAAERLLGWSKEELHGRKAEEFLGEGWEGLLRQRLSEDNRTVLELDLPRRWGGAVPVLLTAARIDCCDQGGETVCLLRDIHELKDAERQIRTINNELLAANATKDRFFSIISHDLRGPFGTILGFAELLAQDAPSMGLDEVQDMADEILKVSQRQYRLLEDLLTWSRLAMGKMTAHPRPLDPHDELLSVIELYEAGAEAKGIKLELTVVPGFQLLADQEMLKTTLRNLIANAIKFSHPGGLIAVRAEVRAGRGVVMVSDSGVGMTPQEVTDIFRLDRPSTLGTAHEKGTGLGLLLCREMMEKCGGIVEVESVRGQGSTFRVILPLAES